MGFRALGLVLPTGAAREAFLVGLTLSYMCSTVSMH